MFIASEEGRAAVLNARAAALNAEIAGMQSENSHRLDCGNSIAYGKEAFDAAIETNRLGENNVILLMAHGEL